jgi:hypothetical protein
MTAFVRRCRGCDEPLAGGTHERRLYCTQACRIRAKSRRHGSRIRRLRTAQNDVVRAALRCQRCGVGIATGPTTKLSRKWCGKRCRELARLDRQRAARAAGWRRSR